MSTSGGFRRQKSMRTMIETLQERRDYLQTRIEAKYPDGVPPGGTYETSERKALAWAIELMETEWHYQTRKEVEDRNRTRALANLELMLDEDNPKRARRCPICRATGDHQDHLVHGWACPFSTPVVPVTPS